MDAPLTIGYEAKRAFHNRSGLGNYSRNLVRALSTYYPDNQYLLYNPKKGKVDFARHFNNVEERLPSLKNKLYQNLWRQKLVSGRAKKDGVQIFHGLSQELPSGLQKRRIKSVVTVHDLIFIRYPQLYKRIDRKIYHKKVKTACKKADKIIVISEQTRQDLQEFLNIQKDKIQVIYQGANPVHWQTYSDTKIEETCRKYNLPEKFGLFIGTLEERKGVAQLLEAQLATQIPMVYIGKETKFWKKTVSQKGFENLHNLIFTPSVWDDEELAHIYQAATFFAYPSVFEGFGIPVLEALLAKTPIITSNVSSLPEAAGPSSILINPTATDELAEAMQRLWDDKNQRQKMAEEGFTFAQQFSDLNIAEKWNQLYRSLLD